MKRLVKNTVLTFVFFNVQVLSFAQEKQVCDSVHAFAENPAEFNGGMKGFYDYLKNFHYQELKADDPVTGKFTIYFIVDQEGKTHDVHVTPETDPGLALQEFLLKMPEWKPATIKGEEVCIQMKIPAYVHFK